MKNELGPKGLQFDAVVSYSSLEHSGLGRYGDPINPWADLITMSRAWCLTKQRGRALIAVPTGPDMVSLDVDGVQFFGYFKLLIGRK